MKVCYAADAVLCGVVVLCSFGWHEFYAGDGGGGVKVAEVG